MKYSQVDKTCLTCGKSFKVQFHRRESAKYCCKDCYNKANAPIEMTCLRCGKQFMTIPSLIKKGKGKWCSRECFITVKEYTCDYCGREFKRRPTNISPTSKHIFCSRECTNKGLKRKVGPDNPNWKGIIYSDTYPKIRINGSYKRMHRVVMEEHLGRPLSPEEHVHHINGDKTDNRLENLQVVTNSQHRKVHAPPKLICSACKQKQAVAKGFCKSCWHKARRGKLKQTLTDSPCLPD